MNFYVYKDKAGEWRWTLKATNGNIIADSSEGYKNRTDCVWMIHRIKRSVGLAHIIEGPPTKKEDK